jgi:cytochrome c
MDLGFNKIAFCVLATGLVLIGLNQAASAFFPHEKEEHGAVKAEPKFGWNVPVPEAEDPNAPKVAEGPRDYFTLISEANLENGTDQITKCKSCHSVENDGKIVQGPPLFGVVGREMHSIAGMKYSEGMMTAMHGNWDYEHLDHFIENPKKTVPGTAMGFVGIRNLKDRMDTIAYLRTLTTGTPLPLPAKLEPAAAPAEGGAPAPAASGSPAPAASGSPAAPASGTPAPAGAASPAAPKPSPAAPTAPATTHAPAPAPH